MLNYFKIGSLQRFLKKYYLGAHADIGLVFGYTSSYYIAAPFTFGDSEIGYILSITEDHSLEFECGINGIALPALLYFSVSFTL